MRRVINLLSWTIFVEYAFELDRKYYTTLSLYLIFNFHQHINFIIFIFHSLSRQFSPSTIVHKYIRTFNPYIQSVHLIRAFHPYIPSVHSIRAFHQYIPSVSSLYQGVLCHNQIFMTIN